jgi:hypothetical protein
MTINIGNSLVEDDTSNAVLTEFGREYLGTSPKRTSGDRVEEVRKRIERWKAQAERVQSRRKKTY